jgi:hypothetical protein
MEKTVVRFFGGAVMAWGTLLGLPTGARPVDRIDPMTQPGQRVSP